MQRMRCAPSECIPVGNVYNQDIVGARSGITPVLVDRDGRHLDADGLRIADLRALPDLLPASATRRGRNF